MTTAARTGLLSTREACAYLSISRWTLVKYARLHRLKSVPFGRARRWPLAELDRMIAIRGKTMR